MQPTSFDLRFILTGVRGAHASHVLYILTVPCPGNRVLPLPRLGKALGSCLPRSNQNEALCLPIFKKEEKILAQESGCACKLARALAAAASAHSPLGAPRLGAASWGEPGFFSDGCSKAERCKRTACHLPSARAAAGARRLSRAGGSEGAAPAPEFPATS